MAELPLNFEIEDRVARLRPRFELPEKTDPDALGPMLDAIEQALGLLVVANQEGMIADADRIAEVASGLLRPNQELLETRLRRLTTLREIFSEGDWISSADLNALQEVPPTNTSFPGSDWKRRKRIFSISHKGFEYFARYQFDALYQPLPVIREIIREFGEVADPWKLAAWFHYPNGWLAQPDEAAVAPKDALHRAADVVNAARQRHRSYVA